MSFLRRCQHPRGGFGGGPQQMAHVATTYAATAALVTLGGPEALGSLDRAALLGFLGRMVLPPGRGGGFSVHDGGEADLRACYCSVAAAFLAGLDAGALAGRAGLAEYVRRCQTYEGGLGGEPGNEAHGGYTYCGLAALVLVGQAGALDLRRLLHWAARMQASEGRGAACLPACLAGWRKAGPFLRRIPSCCWPSGVDGRGVPGPDQQAGGRMLQLLGRRPVPAS